MEIPGTGSKGGEVNAVEKIYAAIDLKSFYASVECVARGMDPLCTNLVVADETRTDKTICLAVSPSLKAFGIPGRPRLFEVKQTIRRLELSTGQEIPFIIAPPRMQKYIDISSQIYNIYLKYISASDIHVYSIDEVFMDLSCYRSTYQNPDGSPMTARRLVETMIKDVLSQTGITATAGIGTNLYLAKIAMDIVAKHTDPDRDGVRIAELDEMSYRDLLWNHRPLTSFWRIGSGTAKRLEANGMYTMGDVARTSLYNEKLLFWLFGVDAELLIDHAWGVEPCTMEDIKQYRPDAHSIGSGQVLGCPYAKEKGRMIVREMADSLALDLVAKGLVTKHAVLHVGYDRLDGREGDIGDVAVKTDRYGRRVPKSAHGGVRFEEHTSSADELTGALVRLYDEIVDERFRVHRFNITFCEVVGEGEAETFVQYDLFSDPKETERMRRRKEQERQLQRAMLGIKEKYGKNAILKGVSLEEGATAMERNRQIGGHRA